MLIIYFIMFVVGLAGIAYSLFSMFKESQPWIAAKRRNRNQGSLFAQLETQHRHLRQLRYKMPLMKSPYIVNFYEQTLMSFETLLSAIVAIAKGRSDALLTQGSGSFSPLESAQSLVTHLGGKIKTIEKAVTTELQGQPVGIQDLYPKNHATDSLGCYFCSKPEIKSADSIVKVKIDGKQVKAHSCTKCRSFLLTHKTIKVLFFPQDGQNVHWSQYRDFVANHSYWNLNDPVAPKSTKSQLRLLRCDN